jgi:hypothetical protein
LNLFTQAIVAIDGSKFKAVNNRDKNFTRAKVQKRIEQVETSIARYLDALDRTDKEDSDVAEAKTSRLKEKIAGLKRQMQSLKDMEKQVEAAPDNQISLTDPDARSMATSGRGTGMVGYNVQVAVADNIKHIKRWMHEGVLDKMQARLERMPEAMTIQRQTVEHTFGTLKAWMGATHFLTKTLKNVRTEMSLQVLAYNMKRMINMFGVKPLIAAIAA